MIPPSNGPAGDREADSRSPDRDRIHAGRPLVLGADQSERGCEERRSTDALTRAGDVECGDVPGDPAKQRREREEHDAGREHEPPAVAVGKRAGGQDEGGEADRVRIDHPLQAGQARIQLPLHARQRDVHNHDVDQEHERRRTDRDQRPSATQVFGRHRAILGTSDSPPIPPRLDSRCDPRERAHPHARPAGADATRAGDRRRARRRRRRRARDGARLAGGGRPGRPPSCPGFTDSHVHFPTWAVAQTRGQPRRVRVARRGARPDSRPRRADRVAGCAASAGAAATGSRRASRRGTTSTRSRGETPAALIAKDYHSLWLNSAALALADGDLEVDGGVVERDEAESRQVCCARRRPGASRSAT